MAQDEREVTLTGLELRVKLTPAGAERMAHLRDRFKGMSFAGVTRQCFRIGDIVTDELANGSRILTQDKSGKIEVLNFKLDIALNN